MTSMETQDLLHVHSSGNGLDMVLLHGWGMHSGIWHDLVPQLERDYRLHRVDLPGHGHSHAVSGRFDLAQLAGLIRDSVATQLQGPAVWLGWSLGGLAALQIALDDPQQVRALILVASTPRFTRAADWPQAMDPAVLENFADQLNADHQATLQRFLALQVKGSEDARGALRELRQRILDEARVDPVALQSGLAILQQADLRQRLPELNSLPLLWIHAGQDRLVPVEIQNEALLQEPNMQRVIMQGAGHAPFISRAEEFIQHIKAFIDATE